MLPGTTAAMPLKKGRGRAMKTIRVTWSERVYYAADVDIEELKQYLNEYDEHAKVDMSDSECLARHAIEYAVNCLDNVITIDSDGSEDEKILLIDGDEV